jgi:catechol 2,3-dioxygenase-like lactoylglutathione lyase family enzyme
VDDQGAGVAFGVEGTDDFGLNQAPLGEATTTAAHVAFVAEDRAAVDAFHAAALAAGGRDKDAPRLHPEYHPGYYAAFVRDPDGNNIEAVVHERD